MIIQEQGNLFRMNLESTDEWYGFVEVSIEAATRGFAWKSLDIDVQRGDLENFLVQLRQLEATRDGSAIFENSDVPEARELRLAVFSIDKLGHMALSIQLKKVQYVGGIYSPMTVDLSFEIDPSNLPYLVSEFAELVDTIKQLAPRLS